MPAGLWIVGREWLPTQWPTPQQMGQALTTPDGGRLLLGALVVIGFAAWALFAVSVALELTARLRRRPAPHVRGMGWAQSIAGVLLTTIASGLIATSTAGAAPATPPSLTPTAIATTTAVATTTASATVQPDADQLAAPPTSTGRAPESAGPIEPRTADGFQTYMVQPHDTLWGLATQWYGDGTQYTKILQINVGRAQPDGASMSASGQLRPGWTLAVPHDADLANDAVAPRSPTAVQEITVKPGDTLSEIAHDALGDASRYTEIFHDNQGVTQRDGRALSDPNLIQPHWKLRVRVPAANPAPDHHHPAPATQANPQAQQPATTPTPSATAPAPAPAPETPTPSKPADHASPTEQTPETRQHQPEMAQQTDASPTGNTPTGTDEGQIITLPTALTVSAVLAAALAGGLVHARRRQLRRRGTGRQIAAPSAGAARVERALRAAAGQADIEFVDLALRSLAAQLADEGRPDDIPDVLCAWLEPEGLRLTLATPRTDPPSPFSATDAGTEWFVPVDAPLPVTPETAADYLAPLPTLVSAGHAGSRQLLLDLEGLRAVQLTGDDTKGIDLLRHLAAELAHNRWSDGLDVLLVGFGAELTIINPDRIRHVDTLDAAIAALRRRLAGAHQILTDSGAQSVLHGRVSDIVGDAWMPEVLLVACPQANDPDQHAAEENDSGLAALLTELAQAERSVVAVVSSGANAGVGALAVNLDMHGELHVPELTDETLRAEGISADLAPHVVELFTAANAPDIPIPAAPESELWAQDMNAAGGLLTSEPRPDNHSPHTADTAPTTEQPDSGAAANPTTSAPQVRTDQDETTPPDNRGRLVEFAPRTSEAQQRLDAVLAQDPGLDADLAAWHAPQAPRPRIGVLGDALVSAPGTAPTQRLQWYTEVLVYLALHPAGVQPAKLVDDLWNGAAVKAVTYRQVMSAVRKWAGEHPDGSDNLTHLIGSTPYQLRDFLLDWQLFRRLRKRAQARAAADPHDRAAAIADYRAALELVRGPVLANQRPGGYNWLANPDQCLDRNLPGFIADCAHELVELALADNDLELATWAATTARRTDAHRTEDRPLLDLMLIAHHRGDHTDLERHAQQLVADAGVELPEDLPPRVYEVFNQLLPHGLRLRPGA